MVAIEVKLDELAIGELGVFNHSQERILYFWLLGQGVSFFLTDVTMIPQTQSR